LNYHAREKDFDSVWYRTVDDDPIPKSIRKGREKKFRHQEILSQIYQKDTTTFPRSVYSTWLQE
jgi:hypothetical protein